MSQCAHHLSRDKHYWVSFQIQNVHFAFPESLVGSTLLFANLQMTYGNGQYSRFDIKRLYLRIDTKHRKLPGFK